MQSVQEPEFFLRLRKVLKQEQCGPEWSFGSYAKGYHQGKHTTILVIYINSFIVFYVSEYDWQTDAKVLFYTSVNIDHIGWTKSALYTKCSRSDASVLNCSFSSAVQCRQSVFDVFAPMSLFLIILCLLFCGKSSN